MKQLETRMIIQENHPFFDCCLEAASDVEILNAALQQLMKETADREMTSEESKDSLEMQRYLRMSEVSAPIFAVTAADSFIHYYALQMLNNKHVHSIEHIDGMDTFSKWIIIPALSCGKEINKNCSAMNDFNRLIKVRNSLIHSKPKIMNNFSDEQVERSGVKIESVQRERRDIARKSPDIFLNLVKELLKIDSSKKLKEIVSSLALPIEGIEPVKFEDQYT